MADLHSVDSALFPGPVKERKAIQATWRLSEFYFTILSQTSHFAYGFSALFRVFTSRTDHCSRGDLFGDPQNVLHDEGEARNINISTLWEVEIVAY